MRPRSAAEARIVSTPTHQDSAALLRRYSGKNAVEYDAKRRDSSRYKSEDLAFEQLYSLVQPGSVLDLPIGTGRFLPLYRARGAKVTGLDLSEDMLAVAAAKAAEDGFLTLLRGDARDPETFRGLEGEFDLVVSVRFLNWLTGAEMRAALENFAALRPRHMILGANVASAEDVEAVRAPSFRDFARAVRRILKRRRATHFVHDEARILAPLADAGYALRDTRKIYAKRGSANFFYLFEET
jgi:SAM-dependent methyltransferase